MRTFFRDVRAGPLLALFALCAGNASAATARTPAHHYDIRGGTLDATSSDANAAASWLNLKGQLSASQRGERLQEGGGFVVLATLAASPLLCGGDLIFANGFDPPE